VVLDDFYPALEARAYWLQHPELFVTEIRVHPLVGTILGTRRAPRP
jgi:hypothetical protein